jgi:hypothetical protein
METLTKKRLRIRKALRDLLEQHGDPLAGYCSYDSCLDTLEKLVKSGEMSLGRVIDAVVKGGVR